jgi:hypothetical protein
VTMQFDLLPSLRSGFNGGLIGGAIAGIIIGTSYWLITGAPVNVVPENTVYAVFVGTMTGLFAQLGIESFRYLARVSMHFGWFFNEPVGGMIAGLVGGIPVGAVGGYWFGTLDLPPINPILLVGGALLGSLFVSAVIVFYDSTESSGRVLFGRFRPYIILLATAALLIFSANRLFRLLGFDEAWFESWTNRLSAAEGGAQLGALIGALMGLQIGCAVYVSRQRPRRSAF